MELSRNLRFRDRVDAGRQLAAKLEHLGEDSPLVLGLARGGVVVAAAVADSLRWPLDVLVARKIGAPFQPELGIGAIAPGGVRFIDKHRTQQLGISDAEVAAIARREAEEVHRRLEAYRRGRPTIALAGRTAVIVDDGLATGGTAVAAARYVRSKNPARVVLAVPVCAPQALDLLSTEVDEVVCVLQPDDLMAVGFWYQSFEQTEDKEVVELLDRFGSPQDA